MRYLWRWKVELTLHHSSPLFTLIIFFKNALYKQWFGHLLWPAPIIYYDQLLSSMMTELRNKVKSGEEWWRVVKSEQALFTSHNPSVYRGFRGICEEWRVKSRVGFFSRKPTPPATRKLLPNRSNSPLEIYITTHYFLPSNGTILPQLRATLCHSQAKSGISLLSHLNRAHLLMPHTLLAE